MNFNLDDFCEICGKETMISKTGICELCYDKMMEEKKLISEGDGDAIARTKNRFKSLNSKASYANRLNVLRDTRQMKSKEMVHKNRKPRTN